MARQTGRWAVALAALVVLSLASVPPSQSLDGDPPTVEGVENHLLPDSRLDGFGGVERVPGPEQDHVTKGTAPAGAADAHASGVTGEDVRVGVIGTSFKPDHPAVEESVAGTNRFGAVPPLATGSHDTAVAELVHDTAPDADLYLASIGPNPTPAEYRAAVEWLLRHDVDVVVDSGSYFPASGSDMSELEAAAEEATDRGVVFVTSAGNYGDRHWRGDSGDGQEWLTFAEGQEANAIGDGPISGQVRLRLYWQGSADYDLYLYRHRPDGDDPVVAKSTANQSGATSHAEAIDAVVPEGRYYVAVHVADAGDGRPVDLFAPSHELAHATTNGSMVAPATGEDVIAVGATDPATGAPRSYSSGGHHLDLRVADGAETTTSGELYGSSAAAPVVAGTAALIEAERADLTPAETQRILAASATGGDTDGFDAGEAVREARSPEPRTETEVVARPDGARTRSTVPTVTTATLREVTAEDR